ncbi:mucin-17-like isoform X10 [Mytilus trossulus]|uniref:mucin-17-like isoform X10 n=1 Tax=Mytilus trossulus TaxID=6551 RepID=UPI003005AB7E
MKSIMVQRFLFGILKIMKEWTSLTYLFFICGLISSINGQQFPVFGQGQQIQGQGNPAQFQQFLQTRQAAPGVGGGTAAGGTATGLTNSVRTVTVPILPAPPGTDLTQGTTFTQFQRGATQTASSDGPIPRFTQGSAFLGRPFTQFGPNMRPFAQGQQMDAASMAAAQQRQAQMQQNAQQFQARQQAGMAAQQAGMAASRTQFPGQGLGENGQMLVLTNRAVNNIRAGRNNIGRTNNLNGVRATRPASSLLSVFALQPGVLNGAGVQGRSVQRNGQQGQSAGVQQPTRTVVQRTNGAGRGTSIAVQRTNGMPRGTNGVNRRQAVTVRRTRLGQNSQAMQRRMAQQQFMAQQQNGNAFMTGLAQRQQAAVQNQQGQQALLRISTAGNLPSFALIDPQSGRQLSGIFPSGSSPMQGAGTLWRPDVRMPGMMTPPGGAFPPRRFPGMFPPGFVNRNIARQNGAATGITGASNALNAPRAQQTQNRLTPPIMNPRDPRLGLMPVQANLQMFGSRQRPFPTPNVAATQTAMNRQNRMNTNAMTAAATNRINPNFPPVNSQFTGAVGSRTMPVNVGTPQGMARRPMTPNFGAFPGGGGRAMPSSVGAFPGSGGGALPSNVGAFPGGSTNTDMSANQIVPSNVDMFPGIGSSSSSTDGSIVTNELPGEISAFPGAESSSGSSASATTEFIGDIPAFPGAESIGASIMTSDLPVFPDTTDLDPMTFDPTFPSFPESGTDLTSFAESRTVNQIIPNDSSMSAVVTGAVSSTTSSVNGEEPGLTAGEIPPPPPVFPAKDINNIPASADAELFPPFDLGRGSTPFSENIPPVPAGEMMGSRQDFRRVNSASTLDVTMVEPNSRTDIKPAVSSFPGANTAEVTPPKTGIYQRGNGLVMAVLDLTNADKNNLGEMMQILQNLIDERNRNMAAPVMTEPTEAPSFSEFPSANFESSFPGAGTSSFPGASTSSIPESGTSSFPGAGTDVASSFPGMGSPVESPKSSVSISGSEVPFVASGFPGSEARSEVNSFPGSDFISAPSANQATETPSGMATFPGSGSNMSGFPGMRTEKSSTVSTSKGVVPPGTVSGIEGFERTESPLSSSIGGVPIELWQR